MATYGQIATLRDELSARRDEAVQMIQTSQARVRQIDQWLEILDGVVLKHFENPKCQHRYRMNIALGDKVLRCVECGHVKDPHAAGKGT